MQELAAFFLNPRVAHGKFMRRDTDPAFEEPFAVRAGLDIMSLLRFSLLRIGKASRTCGSGFFVLPWDC
jgi:hypothetical protein